MTVPVFVELSPEQQRAYIAALGYPDYRAAQIQEWLYRRREFEFSAMRTLPALLRGALQEKTRSVCLDIAERHAAADGTVKYVFTAEAAAWLEAVFIPHRRRTTVCVSTQVGCAYDCLFCASGQAGFIRNLSAGEIVSQVLWIQRDYPQARISHIVFMGMGEPLANYEHTVAAVRLLNHPQAMGIAARHITISTCGIVPAMRRLADEGLPVELSVSLHAPDNILRSRLMPVNRRYPLETLLAAAWYYTERTRRLVTFEYILLPGVNDSSRQAQQLAALLRPRDCKVNLIAYNDTGRLTVKPAAAGGASVVMRVLRERGVKVTLRRSRGSPVWAACGQLSARQQRPVSG